MFLHFIIQPEHQIELVTKKFLVLKDLLKHTKGHKIKEVFVFVLMVSLTQSVKDIFLRLMSVLLFISDIEAGQRIIH